MLLQLLQRGLQGLLPCQRAEDQLLLFFKFSPGAFPLFLLLLPSQDPAVLFLAEQQLPFQVQFPGAAFTLSVHLADDRCQLLQAPLALPDLFPAAAFPFAEQAQLIFLPLHLPESAVHFLLQPGVNAPLLLLLQLELLESFFLPRPAGSLFAQRCSHLVQLFFHCGKLAPGTAKPVGIKLFFRLPHPPVQLPVAAGRPGLPGERFDLHLQFKDQILHPDQVLPGLFETALGFTFPELVFKDAGGLLEYLPAVLRLAVDDPLHPSLSDHGIDLPSHSRIQK